MFKVIKGGVLSAIEAKRAQEDGLRRWRNEVSSFTKSVEDLRSPKDTGLLTRLLLAAGANLKIECPHCHSQARARTWSVQYTDERICNNCSLVHPSMSWNA